MPSFELFGSTFDLLTTVMDLRSKRQSLISSNIANVDTPQYKAVRLDFEQELQNAVGAVDQIKLKRTDAGHLPSTEFNSITYRIIKDVNQKNSPDGNTVDIDRELTKMSQNHLMYSATAKILSKKFAGLRSAIREGK
jgi:flagellar basal-body rod protein FlgB